MREPAFWWRNGSALGALLSPLGAIYGAVSGARMRQAGERVPVPVVCVGNFTLGGSGKTPAAIAIARLLAAAGERPYFLSRGYGGRVPGPLQVDAQSNSLDVGDEPLLLARVAPTIVSRDRVAGARMAHAAGATVVVMDDGLQNPSLQKEIALAVVDGRRGVGNGRVFPAGPLRAPIAAQIDLATAMVVIGEPSSRAAVLTQKFDRPVFHARLQPDESAITDLRGRRVLAFAGIGDPEKFFDAASGAGIDIAARQSFPDHHRFSGEDAAAIMMQVEREGLVPLTTEKDHARMAGDPTCAALYARACTLPVTLKFDDEAGFAKFLRDRIGG